jgi:uncharacterized protein YcbX
MEPFQLPYHGLTRESDTTPESLYEVGIWGDTCWAVDEGDAAATWFSTYLGQPVRLVRTPDNLVRPVSEKYQVPAEPCITGWADGFPFLIISGAFFVELSLDRSWVTVSLPIFS